MQRRSFSTWGGAALLGAARPLAAQPARVFRVGVLVIGNYQVPFQALKDGLRELGYVEGKNLVLDLRSADGKLDLLDSQAAELVQLKPDVIVASLTPAALAAQRATRSIPIIMAGAGDPVGNGLVASLARPGGNVTGLAALGPELTSKSLQLMRELKPGTRGIGALMNAGDPFHKQLTEQLQRDCQALGLAFMPRLVRAESEYDAAFTAWAKARVDAVFIQPTLPLARAMALALQHQLATFSFVRSVAQAGALLTYASNEAERSQRVVWFVDRVLKGAQPATLPAVQPTRFDLIINQKSARALGVTVPPALLLRADEVID